MATNPPVGDGQRKGAVRDRSQVNNPQDVWTKRDAETGKVMASARKRSAPLPSAATSGR